MRLMLIIIFPVLMVAIVGYKSLAPAEEGMPIRGGAGDEVHTVYRDWQVENPFVAGAMKALTFTVMPASSLGKGWREAPPEDPYAVSGMVYGHMAQMARTPHAIGIGVGLAFWISIYFATVYRCLNKLRTVIDDSTRLAHQ